MKFFALTVATSDHCQNHEWCWRVTLLVEVIKKLDWQNSNEKANWKTRHTVHLYAGMPKVMHFVTQSAAVVITLSQPASQGGLVQCKSAELS